MSTSFNNFNYINTSGTNNTSANHPPSPIGIDGRSELLSWISSLESWKRHQDFSTISVRGVGDWVLRAAEFQAWRDENLTPANKVLFCYGIPGAGKTFISSLVIDSLCDSTAGSNTAIVCLYCDYRRQSEQTPVRMIGSLMRQLVTGLPEIPKELIQAFQAAKAQLGGRALGLDQILDIFPQVLRSFEKVFICIDALDEFPGEHRVEFLHCLKQIIEESPNARLFLTGRPYVQFELDKHLTRSARAIRIQSTQDDIKIFLNTKLDADPEPEVMEDGLRTEIIEKLSKENSEIFLLVTLHIDAILGEVTIGERSEKLCQITHDLSDAYNATLERIKRQRGSKSRLGVATLMWISQAERPLSVDELCHALAVKVGSVDLDPRIIPSIETVLGCCLGLVIVDHETSTVRLIHETLQEYIHANPDIFCSPHATITEACLTYLSFQSIKELSPTLTASPPALPFLTYASCYWGDHARKGLTVSGESPALEVLNRFPEHPAANIFVLNEKYIPWNPATYYSDGFSGLHYAAYMGIHKLVEMLLDTGSHEPNQTDIWGRTPLAWAAKNGHESVVKMLLERLDINPNTVDCLAKTPLAWAAENDHEGVVKILVGRADINLNSVDGLGKTPLAYAAENGHEGVVKILLDLAHVNPNSADSFQQTPLAWAAQNGHKGVVKILVERADVDTNTADCFDKTPLAWAAQKEHEGVVKALLGRADVNPSSVNGLDKTPLTHAAQNSHEGIVKILLEQPDVNPNSADSLEKTPFAYAAENGHEGVVQMLLELADINLNSVDSLGKTSLTYAADNGHEGAVKALLDRVDVDPNLADHLGKTPLAYASGNGYGGVVKMLLGRADVNPNSADRWHQTPLTWAAKSGRRAVVSILLDRADIDPNPVDRFHLTPLAWASQNGYDEVVKMLLERTDVDPNSTHIVDRTPLAWAAQNGYERVARALLRRSNAKSPPLT